MHPDWPPKQPAQDPTYPMENEAYVQQYAVDGMVTVIHEVCPSLVPRLRLEIALQGVETVEEENHVHVDIVGRLVAARLQGGLRICDFRLNRTRHDTRFARIPREQRVRQTRYIPSALLAEMSQFDLPMSLIVLSGLGVERVLFTRNQAWY